MLFLYLEASGSALNTSAEPRPQYQSGKQAQGLYPHRCKHAYYSKPNSLNSTSPSTTSSTGAISTNIMKLRDYQTDLIDRVRESYRTNHKAPLLVLPTGGGKTVLFSAFTHASTLKGNRVLILAHRQELLDQISSTLSQFNVEHSLDLTSRAQVLVGSVFTAVNRDINKIDIIIQDEAHHCATGNSWARCFANIRPRYLLGVTATPSRLDGMPLGDIFDDLIVGPTTRELVDLGHLSPYKLYAAPSPDLTGVKSTHGDWARGELGKLMSKPHTMGSAVDHYLKLAHGKRAVIFCASIEHAHSVQASFESRGISTGHLDGSLSREHRRSIVNDFRSGKLTALTSVDVLSEGFDPPAIEVAILLRPTQSLTLYLQQVGRVLRTHPGKPHAIILDHAGNTLRHGLPCDERQWSLTSRIEPKTNKSKPTLSVKVCPQCFFAMKSGPTSCANCNFVFPIESRIPEHVDGELKEIDLTQRRQLRQQQGMAQTYQELVAIGRARGFKYAEKWAWFVLKSRQKRRLGK